MVQAVTLKQKLEAEQKARETERIAQLAREGARERHKSGKPKAAVASLQPPTPPQATPPGAEVLTLLNNPVGESTGCH